MHPARVSNELPSNVDNSSTAIPSSHRHSTTPPMSRSSPSILLNAPLIQEIVPEEDSEDGSPDLDLEHSPFIMMSSPLIARSTSALSLSLPIALDNQTRSYVEHTPIPIGLELRPHSPAPSSSSSSEDDDDDDEDAMVIDKDDRSTDQGGFLVPRKPKIERSGSVVGSSWGISGVGKGFDSSWTMDESESDVDQVDVEDDDDDESPNAEALDVERNTQLNSRTFYIQTSPAFSAITPDSISRGQSPPPIVLAPPTPNEPLETVRQAPPRISIPESAPPMHESPLLTASTPILPPLSTQSTPSRPLAYRSVTLPYFSTSAPSSRPITPPRSNSSHSISAISPRVRSRRRESQKRISLVAGRVVPVPPLLHPEDAGPSRLPSETCLPSPLATRPSSTGTTTTSTSTSTPLVSGSTPLSRGVLSSAEGRVAEKTGEDVAKGGRSVNDFVIQGEAGRGAYGLVKRVREKRADGTLGPSLIMKQVIKSRILADCWKKHPVHGTIPIEIHVMSALSSSSYVLPKTRPWDPLRFSKEDTNSSEHDKPDLLAANTTPQSSPNSSKNSSRASTLSQSTDSSRQGETSSSETSTYSTDSPSPSTSSTTTSLRAPTVHVASTPFHPRIEVQEEKWRWREGAIHAGHPSIIPLLEFFEDAHYYYLILPAAQPSFPPPPFPAAPPPPSDHSQHNGQHQQPTTNKFPSDLFDLVERYPSGLPAPLIRTYLGQIADALAFLHARNICHRDIKDENVVLAEDGRCWLIDFGSSGVIRKEGWDTFSGTLDYAGPEILRGERYAGPPQDVWAFGIVSYVLVTGECPFSTASEADQGLAPGSKALVALEERCGRSVPSQNPSSLSRSTSSRVDNSDPLLSLTTPLAPTSFSSFSSPINNTNVADASSSPFSMDVVFHSEEYGYEHEYEYDAEAERAKMEEGLEPDGGGRLGDVMALIKACLQLDIARRPTFEDVIGCRFLSGMDGWVDIDEIRPLHPPGPIVPIVAAAVDAVDAVVIDSGEGSAFEVGVEVASSEGSSESTSATVVPNATTATTS